MLQGARPFFLLTGVLVCLLLIYSILKETSPNKLPNFAYSLILGGAIGNMIDRTMYGYVVDFLDPGWFPVFNVADSGITVGVALLFVHLAMSKSEESVATAVEEQKG